MSHLRLRQSGGPDPRTHIPHEQGGSAQTQSQKSKSRYDWVSISWCGVHAVTCGLKPARQSPSYIMTESQSASLSWCQAPIRDSRPIMLVLPLIVFRYYGFVDMGRPLWREVGSVLFSFWWASPSQPFWGLSPTGLMSIFYCFYFLDSPNLEGQVTVFISSRNRVARFFPRALGLSNLFTYFCVICL
jgi:hypothetical protein